MFSDGSEIFSSPVPTFFTELFPVLNLHHYMIIAGSLPMYNYGNILYLMSRNATITGVNKNGRELYLSIVYKYNDIIYPGCPLISNEHGQWVSIQSSDLSQLELVLTDFQFKPVRLLVPMFITLEIEPVF
jgi:hypothetical protein